MKPFFQKPLSLHTTGQHGLLWSPETGCLRQGEFTLSTIHSINSQACERYRKWLMPCSAVETRQFEWSGWHSVNPWTVPDSFSFLSQFLLPVKQAQSSRSSTGEEKCWCWGVNDNSRVFLSCLGYNIWMISTVWCEHYKTMFWVQALVVRTDIYF